MDITVQFEVDGEPTAPETLADDWELAEMLEHTEASVRQQVAHKLDGLLCPEHGQPPRVRVSVQYASDAGQMELSYHVDTCCQPFLLRVVQALNH
jgi:hypothetical protein